MKRLTLRHKAHANRSVNLMRPLVSALAVSNELCGARSAPPARSFDRKTALISPAPVTT